VDYYYTAVGPANPFTGAPGDLHFVRYRKRSPIVQLSSQRWDVSERLRGELEQQKTLTYKTYISRKIVTPAEVEDFLKLDARLNPHRSTYLVYSDRNGEAKFVMRIYHGDNDALLPVQFEYPALVLPPGPKIELGRGAKAPDVEDDLTSVFAQSALVLKQVYGDADIPIYAECVHDRLEWYLRKHGFEVFAGPHVPNLPKDLREKISSDFQVLPASGMASERYLIRIRKSKFSEMNLPALTQPRLKP
jgi:hypothetical protein